MTDAGVQHRSQAGAVQGPVAGVVAKGRRIMTANRLAQVLICLAAALDVAPLCH
jgi:hypothetical protein